MLWVSKHHNALNPGQPTPLNPNCFGFLSSINPKPQIRHRIQFRQPGGSPKGSDISSSPRHCPRDTIKGSIPLLKGFLNVLVPHPRCGVFVRFYSQRLLLPAPGVPKFRDCREWCVQPGDPRSFNASQWSDLNRTLECCYVYGDPTTVRPVSGVVCRVGMFEAKSYQYLFSFLLLIMTILLQSLLLLLFCQGSISSTRRATAPAAGTLARARTAAAGSDLRTTPCTLNPKPCPKP